MTNLSPSYTGEVYRDAAGEWRWRARAANDNVVADSSEGYVNRNDCAHMLASVARVDAVIEIDTPGSG